MRRLARWLPIVAVAVAAVFALPRLRLDVDVFNLLPTDSRMVEGLRLYQRSFGASRELIVTLHADGAEQAEEAARSLADSLSAAGLTDRVIWRSPFREDPAALGELLAYVWMNRPAEEFAALASRFDPQRLAPTIEATLERLATSFEPREVARLSRDPFALSDLPAELTPSALGDAGDPFASADGSFRVLLAHPPFDEGNFWDIRRWVRGVADHVETWRREDPRRATVKVRLTGDPAFIKEIGAGLLDDMRLAALGTLSIIAGLFWLAHRRWAPLAWLVSLLLFVVVATVSIGGALLGALNAVSLGFAAILLGLAADYGLILYQEYVADPGRSVSEHRSAIAPSILWAAATTAGAFVMVGRSSLPGLTQLGVLVAIGISLAALVMLVAFLPPIARRSGDRAQSGPPAPLVPGMPGGPTGWIVTAAILVVCGGVLARQLPRVDAGTEELGPARGESRSALEELQREVGGGHEALWLIVAGADEREVAERLAGTRSLLARAVDEGTLRSFVLPDSVWPRPDAQAANRGLARELAARWPTVADAAREAGFTEDGLRLTGEVFASWGRFAETEGVVWPTSPGARWVFRKFAAPAADGAGLLALGRLDVADGTGNTDLLALADRLRSAEGGRLFSWVLLSESLLDTMRHDVGRVLLPMVAILLGILLVAFRRFHEIALSLATLAFSVLCLLAVMTLFGWSWNLMNVMALPLLFGAAIDYGIHIQLALRRHAGDASRVRATVGRAILLCGTSTAAGFGTLAFASNAGLASLGRVCATGILIACLASVTLLPVWWRVFGLRATTVEDPR